MLIFLRKIRQKLVSENKVKSYLLYAVGEIFLVVIGIMIAVQLNNWNQERKSAEEIQAYLRKMKVELPQVIAEKEIIISRNEELNILNRKSLKIMASNDDTKYDSLRYTLGALATAWKDRTTFVTFDEFMARDLLTQVSDDSLRYLFRLWNNTIEARNDNNELLNEEYINSIEPFFLRSFNYSEVAMEKYRKYLLLGGPQTDYNTLAKSLETWNLVTVKLETTEVFQSSQEDDLALLKRILSYLNDHSDVY